jgi:signal transduction histidine kinase
VGISKEEQKRVFEKFYRSGGVQESKVRGSGIGLTLVAHIVESHGGEVFLDSDLGRGTKVTIRLPLKQKK